MSTLHYFYQQCLFAASLVWQFILFFDSLSILSWDWIKCILWHPVNYWKQGKRTVWADEFWLKRPECLLIGSKGSQTKLLISAHNKVLIPFYSSCYFVIHSRWDYISLDHPASSIETFHKTVQWAARPLCITQNTVSRARGTVPMLSQKKDE